MSFGMQNRKGVIAESEDGGGRWRVGDLSPQNDPLMAEVQTVKKAQSEMPDGFPPGGWSQRVSQSHERRMREISGREMR